MRISAPRRGDERGLAIAIFALVLIVLLVFVAFAVDLGAAWAEKRNDQNAADSGALAGAVEIADSTFTGQSIVDEVMDAVESTLERDIPNADWADASNCPGEPPSGFTRVANIGLGAVTPDTNCISFSNSGSEIRVRVPTQGTATQFASVIGIDEIETNAVAQALIELPTPSQTPPFVVPTDTQSGADVCLRAGGSDSVFQNLPNLPYDNDNDGVVDDPDPCDNDVTALGTGQFGTIAPTSYVIDPCSTADDIIEVAIADGIDHQLSRFPNEYNTGDPLERQDGSLCNAAPRPLFPNTMRVDPGFEAPLLTCGLLGSSTGGCDATGPEFDGTTYTARLRRGPFVSSSYRFGNRPIDSATLWSFLVTNGDAPAACAPSVYTGTATFAQKMTSLHTCLRTWQDNDGPIFDESIADSARFSFLPLVDEVAVGSAPSCVSGGGSCVHFEDFVPTFFHRLYAVVSGGAQRGACDDDMTATGSRAAIQAVGDGANDCGQNNEPVFRLGGIVFDCDMLPEDLCVNRPPVSSGPGGDPQFDIFLSE